MTRILCLCLLFVAFQSHGQIYTATKSTISFFAGTPVEDIDAVNEKTVSFMNIETGEVTISIPNKDFHFKRALMEEHFNENYMETSKFPKSQFKGKIEDLDQVDFNSSSPKTLKVTGNLTIHGVSKPRTITVVVTGNRSRLEGKTSFTIPLADHNIDRPKLLWEKLAENVDVKADLVYEPYNAHL